ncbi:hypothetical protein JAO78_000570 [Alishewanella sp. 16-MA]|uniref:Uncharacterized protein n=1 Tax=Alishewanella maricola TaxID=2795740 RepID=A0ABS8BZ21_9ALTE|nr:MULTISPECIES: hypothetical protein [Gammaproteobacteria]MDP4945435.1 hypothetical protein [Alishewanella sp.]MCB5225310.1 hypothetical protein [Alishewanella maricola]MCC5450890.1 hypothetical protein [Rheinheimera sp. UJ51]MCF4008436.1 hypothetical protein [Rheinheimera sp. UJ63]MDP5036906.1 hypothetical protein [Alishewanella sp.]
MSDNRLFLLYDASFDEMDAEGCPGFGYVLLFSADDVEQFQPGENPECAAVSMLFTDHADGSISGDLLGWAHVDAAIFQEYPLGQFLVLMEQAAQVAINAYRQVGQVPDKLVAVNLPDDELLQFDVQFNDLQLTEQQTEQQLAQQLMLGRPYLDS